MATLATFSTWAVVAGSGCAQRSARTDAADATSPQRVEIASAGRARGAGLPSGSARPGTERWYRERFDELARRDPARFASEARARLPADGELPERVALLKVASRRDAALADELWKLALDSGRVGRSDVAEAALHLLSRDAPRSRNACRRLLECAVLVRELDARMRARAALTLAQYADEPLLEAMAPRIQDEPDATVRAALLDGLRRNPSAAAVPLANDLACLPLSNGDVRGIEAARRVDEPTESADGP